MKIGIIAAVILFFAVFSVFGNGIAELVNTQEIDLTGINDLRISYTSASITLINGTTDKLIVKEYMSENNPSYYARINKSGSSVTIENGIRPIFQFRPFYMYVEIYLPSAYQSDISIKTVSGRIESQGTLTSTAAKIETSSGSISAERIAAVSAQVKTMSGSIRIEKISGVSAVQTSSGSIRIGESDGNITLNTSSGSIDVNQLSGNLSAKTSSGRINIAVSETTGNITLQTSSGSVQLEVPRGLNFNYTSRSSSGSLSAPFSDSLSSPLNNRRLVQGSVGEASDRNVEIYTTSGSIRVSWK